MARRTRSRAGSVVAVVGLGSGLGAACVAAARSVAVRARVAARPGAVGEGVAA
jgi:D-arabinose 1-dehydrogenase-like Zn-dependent alcohol dehydrogenase